MPETYQTVTARQPLVRPPITINRCDGSTKTYAGETYDVPVAETREFEPQLRSSWRTARMNKDFHARKRAGEIVMAPYSIGNVVTDQYLVERPRRFHHRAVFWDQSGSLPTGTCCDEQLFQGTRSWTEVLSPDDLGQLPVRGELVSGTDADVAKAVSLTQQEAYARSYGGVDLLTEIAESGKTYRLGVDLIGRASRLLGNVDKRMPRNVPKGWKRLGARALLRSGDKLLRRAGTIWLGAIYGVMPVAYLIKDAMELKEGTKSKFHTSRSKRTISVSTKADLGDVPDVHVRYDAFGEITVRSTVKARYALGTPQYLVDQLSLNVPRTLWELTPYSFVVDWFINAGDIITSQTALDLSTQRVGCTAVKRVITEYSSLVDNAEDVSTHYYQSQSPCALSQVDEEHRFAHGVDALMSTTRTKSYDRTLFSRPEPALHFDVNLHWKNIVSGLALAYRPTRNVLSKLRI